jgi:5,6-dimethylbenzimidazole synthase
MSSEMDQHIFPTTQKKGVYRAIYERRDIRKEFLSKAVSKKILLKLIKAAHHAGSVGFMQPWNFIVIDDQALKSRVKDIFQRENIKAGKNYRGERREKYNALKLEGIEEAPVNICVTCDPDRGGPHVIGRNTIKAADVYSACCAIQNLWLAARSEGLGMGWVSIINNRLLKKVLRIPGRIKPVAYLCLGYVSRFPKKPLLETCGWRRRLPLKELVYWNTWKSL